MNLLFPVGVSSKDQSQSRLLFLATLFLGLYAIILTLSPAVRLHSWQVAYRWNHWIGYFAWLVGFSALHRFTLQRIPDRDPYLLPLLGLLSGWGLLTIWRLDSTFGLRQTVWLLLGLALIAGVIFRPQILVVLRRYKYIWLTSGLILTALTFVFGTYPGGNGPHLWLPIFGAYLQPSEPLKLLLVIYLAAYLADRTVFNFHLASLLLPTLILTGAALALLAAQRDLGTASLFIVLYSLIVYLGSGKRRLLVVSALLILLAGAIGYRFYDVIQVRIAAWLNPWIDANGHSYQIVQSLIAIATGGILGDGPGIGNPSVVPVAQSDFIFAAISEETGLAGAIGLILIIALMMIRGMVIALKAPNNYQRFLAAGISVYLTSQSILIIAGNLRLLPLTGVTLPFVSYGGSSLLTSFFAFSLLFLISSHSEEEVAPLIEAQPFLVTGALLLAGLLAIGTVDIFWSVIHNGDLQQRADNPRWAINDRYVPRGRILDRNNQPIVVSTGTPGDYTRMVLDPSLGPVVGYSSSLYGQAGLEATMDTYLRGLEGNPTSAIFMDHLLYGQTPPGLDVRLSIDLRIQQEVDMLMANKKGALVLLNSQTGEILAMASHPGYDPNQLSENWSQWIQSDQAVFLNRATQGQYSPGTALGPFLLAAVLNQGDLPVLPDSTSLVFDGANWDCAIPVSDKPTWGDLISHGCPGAVNELAQRISSDQLIQLFHQLELDHEPQISLPVATVVPYQNQGASERLALGEGTMSVSPLQMALAASALSPAGAIPVPRVAIAVDTPLEDWVVLPAGSPPATTPLNERNNAMQLLQMSNLPAWQITSTAQSNQEKITWVLAGTGPDWSGTPLSLALVLENNDPEGAQKIGETILQSILAPPP